MELILRLKDLLLHEIHGSFPCGADCVPGGYQQCYGCDVRVKEALQRVEEVNREPRID